jgi:tetratricopeptide (TPR) repeat protein
LEHATARAGVLEMLPELDAATFGFIDDEPDSPQDAGERSGRVGESVGPYRLTRFLAEGGMGTVWLADRADGILQRAVALKLPRGAWAGAESWQRMARERQILASLNHPHIARLYDAGVTGEGQPYLALEYVEGRSLDVYARDMGLDTRSLAEIGLDHLGLGDRDRAESALEESLALFSSLQPHVCPARVDVQLGLGRLKMERGRPREALALFQAADAFWQDFDPENRWAGESAFWLGRCYQALGRRSDARRARARADKIRSLSPLAIEPPPASTSNASRG